MPGRVNAAVTPGHYARKQLLSRSGLVAWSHTSRFELARRLVEPRAGGRLLDYGCGDGTFLARVADLFPSALGVDAAADQIEDCARRFAGVGGVRFAPADALAGDEHTAAYDVVVCMEVLEHCPEDLQGGVLDTMRRAAAPAGLVVISVPIEIGPSLIAKQAARALAAFRGLREYAQRERYRPDELVRMVFAGAGTRIPRPETTASLEDGSTMRFTGHKGFNWKRLAVEIAARFHVDAVRFSPMPLCGALLNSQVWFVGTPREEGADDECCRVNPDCQMANGEVSERTIPRRNP